MILAFQIQTVEYCGKIKGGIDNTSFWLFSYHSSHMNHVVIVYSN